MKLVLLGTSGYHPSDRRHTACLMLPELGVVFDAGTGMYRVSDHLQTDTLDVFLSHAHLDHVMGLTYMFDIIGSSDLQVTVRGEQEKLDAIRTHLFSEFLFPTNPPFKMQALEQKFTLADGSVLTHFPLTHPGGSVGYRIDWPDRSFAYVTDTVAAPEVDYIDLIRGVDLLVHECFFDDNDTEQAELTGHSCISPVAHVAKAAEVGRLVLVHINPILADDGGLPIATAQKIFPNTELGTDGMVIEF